MADDTLMMMPLLIDTDEYLFTMWMPMADRDYARYADAEGHFIDASY